jgi:hypothetical protein
MARGNFKFQIAHFKFGNEIASAKKHQAVSQLGFRESYRRFQAKNEGHLTDFGITTRPVRSE